MDIQKYVEAYVETKMATLMVDGHAAISEQMSESLYRQLASEVLTVVAPLIEADRG